MNKLTWFGREIEYHESADPMVLIRLLNKIDFNMGESPGACWLWTAAVEKHGYPRILVGRSSHAAHRVLYGMLVDPVHPSLDLHHRCVNPLCVNPEHLQPLTKQQHFEATYTNILHGKSKQTHCHAGHEYTPENTHITPDGDRRCRACAREWQNSKNAMLKAIKEAADTTPDRGNFCFRGHELTPENTYEWAKGGMVQRTCKTCHNINSTSSYHNRKKEIVKDPERIPNADKTVCPMGHEYTPENTYVVKKPGRNDSRVCKTCHDARGRANYYKKIGELDKYEQLRGIFEKVGNFTHTDLNTVTAKLACPMGHTYLPDNFYEKKTKLGTVSKVCKICTDARNKAIYYRKTGHPELAEELEKIFKKAPKSPEPPEPKGDWMDYVVGKLGS